MDAKEQLDQVRRTFEDSAIVRAKKRKLTLADVERLDYRTTAELAGVTIAPDGTSPPGFFWEQTRRHLVKSLTPKVEVL